MVGFPKENNGVMFANSGYNAGVISFTWPLLLWPTLV